MYERPVSSSIQPKRRKKKIPKKYLRDEPAIIPLESVIPEADQRTKPIMLWLDLTDLDQREAQTEELSKFDEIPTSTLPESTSYKIPLITPFEKEIAEMFDIPKEQILHRKVWI